MMKAFLKLVSSMAMVLAVTSVSRAELIDRGGGFIYDSVYDITWLQDANYAKTSGYDTDGLMDWQNIKTWVDDLVYEGYDDWRLPSALNQDGSGPYETTPTSELWYMYHDYGITLTTPGPFINLPPYNPLKVCSFWLNEEDGESDNQAWNFSFYNGTQNRTPKDAGLYAWAVLDGDVQAAPEPVSTLLFSLGGITLLCRRIKSSLNPFTRSTT